MNDETNGCDPATDQPAAVIGFAALCLILLVVAVVVVWKQIGGGT